MFEFLFGSNKNENKKVNAGFINVKKEFDNVFVVLHKNTQEIIGVFDSLDKAKEQGQKSTYHTCMIYSFKLNGNCMYLNTAVHEDS